MAQYAPELFLTRSGDKLILRHCCAADASEFIHFQQAIASETQFTLQGDFNTPEADAVQKYWSSSEADERVLVLGVFTEQNKMVALMGVKPENSQHPWIKHVAKFGMMIVKAYWRQGIGRRMLEVLDTFASSAGFTRIEAQVRVKNERAVKLYKNAGYLIEGTRKNAAFIDGEYVDEYYIAKLNWP